MYSTPAKGPLAESQDEHLFTCLCGGASVEGQNHRVSTFSHAFCGGASQLKRVSVLFRAPTICCRKQVRNGLRCAEERSKRGLGNEMVQNASYHWFDGSRGLIMRTVEEEEAGPH